MKTLTKFTHGSRLYRTHDAGSDFDQKSIFLPNVEDCLLLRAKENVGAKTGEAIQGDKSSVIECENIALQSFLKNAANGEDYAITSLHVRDEDIDTTSDIFEFLRVNRKRFYTKGMAGSLGYAKNQAFKFALRADRLENVEKALECLRYGLAYGFEKLSDIWKELPVIQPHLFTYIDETNRNADKRMYCVAGKSLPAPVAIDYAISILENLVKSYGERVKNARNFDNKDLKSISHAFRCGYQLRAIFTSGDFAFPLAETEFIKDVKYGKVNYVDDKIDEKLNALISEVENLSAASNLSNKVDKEWLDSIVVKTYMNEYNLKFEYCEIYGNC